MFLAHLLWEELAPGERADDDRWERALLRARTWLADEALAVWSSLSPAQQDALRDVHRHGSATLRTIESRVPRSTLATAQEVLVRQALVEEVDRPGPRQGRRFRVVDPLLGDWMERRRQGAVGVGVLAPLDQP